LKADRILNIFEAADLFMKNTVIQNIRELLFYHECVIIPDFGGFVLNFAPAKVDEKSGLFTPPGKQLVFNKNLTNNDGLLINQISKNTGLNYIDSKNLVVDFVSHLKNELNIYKTTRLEDIGVFRFEDTAISFEPTSRSNYNLDVYGMTSFSFPVLSKPELIQEIEQKFKDRPSVKQAVKKRNVRRVLIGLPLIIALALFPFKSNLIQNYESAGYSSENQHSSENHNNPNSIEEVIEQMTQKENALMYVESEKYDEKIEDELIDTSNKIVKQFIPKKITTPVDFDFDKVSERITSEKKYHIIAGSFANQNRANRHCDQMKKVYPNAFLLPREDGRIRLSLGGV
jgi:nucleoid DNA-binding protein